MLLTIHTHKPKVVRPAQPLDRYVVELPDGTRLQPRRSCIYAAARDLEKLGHADDTRLEFQHAGSPLIAARGTIGELKLWTVYEGEAGLRRVKYVPFAMSDDS